jgi:photosystem II stability/assembly factor-like uncharacterized protein
VNQVPELRRALDDEMARLQAPPGLESRVLAQAFLDEQSVSVPSNWILAAVAALLALAVVATLVIGAHALRPRSSVPVQRPQRQAPASASCPGWGPVNFIGSWPIPEKMTSATTGWAMGALRTTDGGANWHDVSPSSLRADAPPGAALSNPVYPPGYAEFFLDANHAWLTRNYSSPAACTDHVIAFATSDGGRTWQPSASIDLKLDQGSAASSKMFFLDPHDGWLWLAIGPIGQGRLGEPEVFASRADLYATSDGGLNWHLVSSVNSSKIGNSSSDVCSATVGDLAFASQTDGWLTIPCQTAAALLVTRDGGLSWKLQRLSLSKSIVCPCSASLPTFFDAARGIVELSGSGMRPSLLATLDGGRTWRELPALPGTGYSMALDFVDANNFWYVGTPPGWIKPTTVGLELYRTTDGGKTWTLVRPDATVGPLPVYFQFVDVQHGFALTGGSTSTLLATADGGRTWKAIQPKVS